MLISVACPRCAAPLKTSPDRLGQRKKCPQCHELVLLPALTARDETAVEIPVADPKEIRRNADESK
jgi:phage FluMu protein Com